MNTENQMDAWDIKMVRPMTLWGMISPRIEAIVARYGDMIDHARSLKDAREIEKEFIITMYFYGVICEFTKPTR